MASRNETFRPRPPRTSAIHAQYCVCSRIGWLRQRRGVSEPPTSLGPGDDAWDVRAEARAGADACTEPSAHRTSEKLRKTTGQVMANSVSHQAQVGNGR